MKKSVKSIKGFSIGATDGEIGKVKDIYFDDTSWTVRYLVVDTGNWLTGRTVLLAPEAINNIDFSNEVFAVSLTKEQVKHSPDIDTEKPVTRQEEIKLYEHYPWTSYWGGGLWAGGLGTTGMVMPINEPVEDALARQNLQEKNEHHDNPHLRSSQHVKGYTLQATDGAIGDIDDFIIDTDSWKINYLVADTGHWLPGKKVLISPTWIEGIIWETASVKVNHSVESVKNSPEYDKENPLTETYEHALNNYYSGI